MLNDQHRHMRYCHFTAHGLVDSSGYCTTLVRSHLIVEMCEYVRIHLHSECKIDCKIDIRYIFIYIMYIIIVYNTYSTF